MGKAKIMSTKKRTKMFHLFQIFSPWLSVWDSCSCCCYIEKKSFCKILMDKQELLFECSHCRISSAYSKVRTTIYNYHKQYHMKVLLSTHFRISSTDSKVKATLYSFIINSTTGNYCSVSFHLNGHTLRIHPHSHKFS